MQLHAREQRLPAAWPAMPSQHRSTVLGAVVAAHQVRRTGDAQLCIEDDGYGIAIDVDRINAGANSLVAHLAPKRSRRACSSSASSCAASDSRCAPVNSFVAANSTVARLSGQPSRYCK
jgi:hypothetical protein